MEKKRLALYSFCALLAGTSLHAQEQTTPLKHLSLGLRLSTLGIGVEAATPLFEKHLTLRAGLNLLPVDAGYWNVTIPDDAENHLYQAFGYVPKYRARPKMDFMYGDLLVDYHPHGIFHLTAGFYIGESAISVKGYLADWRNGNSQAVLKEGYKWPSIDLNGQLIETTGGRANVKLRLGYLVKPYLGLGVGRALAKNKRLSFKFELGALYQGPYTLRQNGKKLDLAHSDDADTRDIDRFLGYLCWWPMMNFQLSYRIF
ncbi:MAG: hypothetical protein LBL81_01395 [Tannerella sp.]|jgi:hypothetical protein|nr:hypothetical protein [Tannerella sp.]